MITFAKKGNLVIKSKIDASYNRTDLKTPQIHVFQQNENDHTVLVVRTSCYRRIFRDAIVYILLPKVEKETR